MASVSGAWEPVALVERVVYESSMLFSLCGVQVVCVCVVSSTTPTVVTSSVGFPRFCVSLARVFVLGVCTGTCIPLRSVSSVLDTLTPLLELYIWQWDRDWELGPESLKVPGMFCGGVVHSLATVLPIATVIQVATSGCVVFLSRLVNRSRQGSTFGLLIGICYLLGWQVGQSDLSGYRGAPEGRALLAVGAAIALRLREVFPFILWHWSLVEWPTAHLRSGTVGMERGGGSCGFVKAPLGFGSSIIILAVCLPSDVATAERVATSEEASLWSDATLSLHGRAVCAGVGRRPFWGFLEGVLCVPVITVTWDPQPCTSVEGVLRAAGVLKLASPSHCLALRWFRSRVRRSGVGPQLGQAAVVCGCSCWDSQASLYPGSCRQESAAGELEEWTVLHGGCSLAVSGAMGLVGLTSWAMFSGFGYAFSLEVSSGGRACGETVLLTWLLGVSHGDTWLFLPDLGVVRDVDACVVRLWSHMVAPVFRVVSIPTLVVGHGISQFRCFVVLCGTGYPYGALFARLTPLLSSGRDSLLQEFLAGRSWWRLVHLGILARAKQMLVCCVALLAERCDTWLWLLSACVALWVELLCYLMVEGQKVGFVSRTLWALPDGSLVSAMGVWLVVLLWKCQSRLVVSPCGAHCCDLLVESSSLGLDYCVQPARLLLVKVVDLDPVCGPVFGQFAVLFTSKFLGCADRTTCCLGWWCFHMAFSAMSRTVAIFVAKASFRCVFLLCLSCALEALVAIGHVALPTNGVGATVLHLAEFWCLWWHPLLVLEWFVFVPSGALVHCVALWVALGACVSTTTRMIWVRSSGAGEHCLALRGFSTCVFSNWFRVIIKKLSFGLAVVCAAPVELSTSDCVLRAGWWALCELSDVRLGAPFVSHVGRSGVGPQLGHAAVVCGCSCWDSLASLYRGGCRQESAAGELEEWTVSPPLTCLCLAVSGAVGLVGLSSWAMFTGFRSAGSLEVSSADTRLLFQYPFLGVVCGGTGVRAYGETVLLTWLLGVSRCDTWLFLPDLVEVRDVGACVVRLWLTWLLRCSVSFFVPAGSSFASTFVGVPAALAGRDSLSQEFIIERSWWRLLRRA
ncbi:hypothetical protein Taro_001171 [Colocasia esculenta]|uniref:Uncharacterized protein n=1 Tax=Colocasia esculenta TaxID=4460 RepID=A0A843TH48_COLES|nr:hypothetical protein [Colocasia esculenta]